MGFNDNYRWEPRDPTWRERVADNQTIGDYFADAKDLVSLKSGRFIYNNIGKLSLSGATAITTAVVRGINERGIDRIFYDQALPTVPDAINIAQYGDRGTNISTNFFLNTIGTTGAEILNNPLLYTGIAVGAFAACAAISAVANIKVKRD